MIVQRITMTVPWEHRESFVELIKYQRKVVAEAGLKVFPQRLYRYRFGGEADTYTLENQFESLSELESWYDAWWALKTTPAFQEGWFTYAEGQYEEILDIHIFE